MRKVLSVIGTRPEAIKMAPVIKELQNRADAFCCRVCVTAQHREMLDQVLDLFDIRPDHDLNVMRPNQTLEQLTARILIELTPVIQFERPDWLLIQGDTTTVMAAALAAFYEGVSVGHVEAGLRTYDKRQPFPEEINRRIASVLADLHFAPTERAKQNLQAEGIPSQAILVTGNPVIDALQWTSSLPYDCGQGPLAGIPWDRRIVMVTAHRRENFGAPLVSICRAIQALAEMFRDDIHFVYPVHLNPNVRGPVYEMLGDVPDVTLLPPLDYLPLVQLMKRCCLVLTDSGGIQEEAPGLGKPVLVLRETTERPEAIEAGTARLVGTDPDAIVRGVWTLLTHPIEYAAMVGAVNPFGDGQAAKRIVAGLSS